MEVMVKVWVVTEKRISQTGTIIWENQEQMPSTLFFHHQGTKLIPADFIGYHPLYGNQDHHNYLNFLHKLKLLMQGKLNDQIQAEFNKQGSVREQVEVPFTV
jgi:glucose-6-phosphate isomerase